MTPLQIAALHGYGKWSTSGAVKEENERLRKDQEAKDAWFFSDAVSPEQARAVFRREARIEQDESGNFTITEN